MNKIQKPEWLLFAERLRVRIDNMPPNKSGKREARAIYDGWLQATRTLGYQGSDRDWECLLRNLGRVRRKNFR